MAFTGKVALITGGGSGMGQRAARVGYIMRRLFPNYVWNHVHKTEGF